jgi:nucleoside-diphosphate-sugar epimerase
MTKRILVTGGAGYIGSVFVPELLSRGHHVTVIDNFLYKQPSLAGVVSNPNLNLVYGDIRDYSLMKKYVTNADVVIPLAAIVGAPACAKDPLTASSINKDATIWLFDQLSKDQQIVMPTTNSAYGSGDKNNLCDESSPLNPLSLYAKDKVVVEKHLMERELATSFRLATVFGISPRMRLDLLVNNFVHRAMTDKFVILFEGHFKRNYVHVRDVSRAFTFAVENPGKVVGDIFNFGLSEANISKQELCEAIQEVIPEFTFLDAPLAKDPDQRNYIVSNEKIESRGMKAEVGLLEGIQELVKGLKMFEQFPFSNL